MTQKTLIRIFTLLLMVGCCSQFASAQYYHPRPHYHHSRTGSVLRGLDAVETAVDYGLLGYSMHRLDDYTGLRIGYNSASLKAKGLNHPATDDIGAMDLGLVFGWYVGRNGLIFEPGLYYSMKGGALSNPGGEYEFTMHSFELPLVLKYNIPLVEDVNLQPFVGAFMSFGFAGTATYDDLLGYEEYDTFDDGVLEDFDAGLRFGAGLSIDRFYAEVAYDLGLVNLCERGWFDHGDALRSRTLSINVGINF